MDPVLKLILEALELADAARLEQLDAAIREEDIKRQALELEQARLASKYGADSAEARQAAARRQAQVALVAELQEEFELLTGPMPEPDADHGVLYGRVLTHAGAGAADLVVAA